MTLKYINFIIMVEKHLEDILSQFLMLVGSPSILVDDPSLNVNQQNQPDIIDNRKKSNIPDGFIKIVASFEKTKSPKKTDISSFLSNITSNYNITTEEFSKTDWNENWKKDYKGIDIPNFISIIPPWLSNEKIDNQTVIINPGCGFGSGTHPTTLMTIKEMQKIDFKGLNVLDAGCGSGILGICAKKLGAHYVEMIEHDADAIINATENLSLNKMEDDPNIQIYQKDLIEKEFIDIEKFDIIFSNIILNVNIKFIELNRNKFKKSAKIFLTGVLKKQNEEFILFLKKMNLKLENTLKLDEWRLYHVINN